MPTYNVIDKGFYNGMMYSPKHPSRNILVSDVPLNPEPSWLEKVDGRKAPKHAPKQKEVVQNQKAVDNGVETL